MNAPSNTTPEDQKRINDALAALRRAKRRADELAIATGTELVEADSNGNVVLLTPAEIIARQEQRPSAVNSLNDRIVHVLASR